MPLSRRLFWAWSESPPPYKRPATKPRPTDLGRRRTSSRGSRLCGYCRVSLLPREIPMTWKISFNYHQCTCIFFSMPPLDPLRHARQPHLHPGRPELRRGPAAAAAAPGGHQPAAGVAIPRAVSQDGVHPEGEGGGDDGEGGEEGEEDAQALAQGDVEGAEGGVESETMVRNISK